MTPAPGDLRVNDRLVLPRQELEVSFARSGGPGGQKVNKTESKVVLRFSIPRSRALGEWRKSRLFEVLGSRLTQEGDLVLHASRYRERERNLEDARERLASLLREALRPVRQRRATRPTRASKRRRLESKKRRAEIKRQRRPPHD